MSAKTLRVVTVVGARPQFVKAATVSRAFAAWNAEPGRAARFAERIVHTGQHYDENMSQVFFDELSIPRPHVNLEVGSMPQGAQTGAMLERIERVLLDEPPDWVLVYGDTNSTLAGALAAVKLHVPIAHVEGGLRSHDLRMPEEVNRILTDRISSPIFAPSGEAMRCLEREGLSDRAMQVGDVMYDSVLFNRALAASRSTAPTDLGLQKGGYYLATCHRQDNTADPARLDAILAAMGRLDRPVILPLHPRTRAALGDAGIARLDGTGLRPIEPVSYLDMLSLLEGARICLTDSGGLQREAFWLGVPGIVLRETTEWVELVEAGCSRLVGADPDRITAAAREIEAAGAALPEDRPRDVYGDGRAAEKIVAALADGGRRGA